MKQIFNASGFLFISPILIKLPHRLAISVKMTRISAIIMLFLAFICFMPAYGISNAQESMSQAKLISSDANGVTIELGIDDLSINNRELDGSVYHLISYKDCAFTSETGKPKLPVTNVFLGVPPSASMSVSIVESKYTDSSGYNVMPVPEQVVSRSSDGIESLMDKFAIDREFYRQNILYPSPMAQIVYEGNIRRQRTVILQIRPIQYNPALKLLRKYSKIVVRVNFSSSKLAPSNRIYQDKEFENSYKSLLLNYDSARNWRTSSSVQKAPSKLTMQSYSPALKLFISKRGIYKVDYSMILGAGIDPSSIDPRTFKIIYRDSEVPIYVHGEVDGKFDKGDYIQFLGLKSENIYTRWNVYWLTWGDGKGLRMVQKNGIPSASTATEVTFFKSRVRFEENHLHHKLQNVSVNQDDPDTWFESRDHWFWTGVENGSPKNETSVKFPVYDLAQSLARPDFKVELVGCTNYEHQAMISVNGNKVGDEAKWNSQDIYTFDGQIPATAIKEGFDNELRITRIGSNPSDGQDLDSYPYQLYLNWFEIGYFRKLIAVNDFLEFSTPEQKEPKSIVSIGIENRLNFDRGKITPELSLRLNSVRVNLSENATITMLEPGIKWMLIDNQQTYLIVREMDSINIYANDINNYTVSGFLDKDIEIFQISGSNAISKFKNPIIKGYKMNQEEIERLKLIKSHASNEMLSSRIAEVAYMVTFEDAGNKPFEYIAVSSASIMRPDMIELDNPSELKSPANRADYVIISHPKFLQSAKRLAEWRSGNLGGGFATKVVDVTDVYDEFGQGMVSPHAIKGFIKYAYNNWIDPAPAYVLIFGDGTYDFLGIDKKIYKEAPELIGFIPPFYIKTTFGQTSVDHWYSTIDGNDGFPDIYLGRIPVEHVEEAEDVVDKIIANESGKINGEWRKRIMSIADDETHAAGDEIFQIGLEDVWLNHTPVGYDTTKIYLKDIIKQVNENPNETRIPSHVTQDMIKEAFAKGAVIAQYSGHGGRHVWAHEIIFSITKIEELQQTETYPFLLVFSCYNGYFDVPGELSMAEGMVRAKRKGAVAMLSATRLTYGHGNVVLNNLLFDGIFRDKLLRIGQATAISKTRLLKKEGVVWLNQMYQYTLFGDPASRLNIPDYEVQTELANLSVASGGKLDIKPSKVSNLKGQQSSIGGNATAKMILPNGNTENSQVNISNGTMSALSFNIPSNTPNGTGYLKIFGETGSEAIIGGLKFSVGDPFIINIDYEITNDKLQIYAKIDDDAGSSRLRSVNISWNVGSGLSESQMIYDQAKGVYRLRELIDVKDLTRDIMYIIRATDQDGNSTSTNQMLISLSSRPNLNISKTADGSKPDIIYRYSTQLQKWGLSVGLSNTSKSSVSCQVKVKAYDGNPDMNRDRIPDSDAKLLGEATVNINDWITTDSQTQTANIFIPCTIQTGTQFIFVWVDPPNNDGVGDCNEENENDNISNITLDIANALLMASQELIMSDTSNVINVVLPSGSANQNTPLEIRNIDGIGISNRQPSISFVASPNGRNTSFKLFNPNDIESKDTIFDKAVSLKIVYDISSIRYEIKKSLGLASIPDDSLDSEQAEILKKKLDEYASKMGIYKWYESANRWAKLPSRPIYKSGSELSRSIHALRLDNNNSSNSGSGIISMLSLDRNASTPVDEWHINFIDSIHYRVEGIKSGRITQNGQDYIGTVGDEFYDKQTGIRLKISNGINLFTSGDVLRFKTMEVGTIEADSEQSGVFCLMMNKDNTPPNIKIDVANQHFANGNVVSSEPEIHVLVSDENGIDLLSRKIDILISFDGGDFKLVDSEKYLLGWNPASNDVTINYAPNKLDSGTYEIKVMAYDFNGNIGIRSIQFDVKSNFKLEEKSLMNYPNPFERETDITFQISSVADEAVVKIYTVTGRLIKTLKEYNVVNFVVMRWDGRDEDGREVANSVYYYKLRLKSNGRDDVTEIGKMLKLK